MRRRRCWRGCQRFLKGSATAVRLESGKIRLAERRHHVLGEPAELILELGGRNSPRPTDHKVVGPGIRWPRRLEPADHLPRRAAEPSLVWGALPGARAPPPR